MTSPPFLGIIFKTSSGTFRGWSASANADEWEKMTGARVTRRTCRMVSAETCEMSTIIPSRFISWTTSSPNGERPFYLGLSVAESAQSSVSEWVSVMYRTPRS